MFNAPRPSSSADDNFLELDASTPLHELRQRVEDAIRNNRAVLIHNYRNSELIEWNDPVVFQALCPASREVQVQGRSLLSTRSRRHLVQIMAAAYQTQSGPTSTGVFPTSCTTRKPLECIKISLIALQDCHPFLPCCGTMMNSSTHLLTVPCPGL